MESDSVPMDKYGLLPDEQEIVATRKSAVVFALKRTIDWQAERIAELESRLSQSEGRPVYVVEISEQGGHEDALEVFSDKDMAIRHARDFAARRQGCEPDEVEWNPIAPDLGEVCGADFETGGEWIEQGDNAVQTPQHSGFVAVHERPLRSVEPVPIR